MCLSISSMRIILTGVPGTGKTEVAKILAKKLKANLVDINRIIEEHGFFSGMDEKDKAKIVKLKSLEDYIRNHISTDEHFIIEGHIACELELPAEFVFVLRTHPSILRRRLAKRKYSKEKIETNVSCEILDYCVLKSESNYNAESIYEINSTNKKPEKVAKEILEIITGKNKEKNKEKGRKHIDWSKKMFKEKIDIKKIKAL